MNEAFKVKIQGLRWYLACMRSLVIILLEIVGHACWCRCLFKINILYDF